VLNKRGLVQNITPKESVIKRKAYKG